LHHILDASGVGAELEDLAIPIHADATGRKDPLAAALFDGEDYELLFTLPSDQTDRLIAAQPLDVKITRLGGIVAGSGMTLLRDGKREKLDPRGWEHET
jgi:thiamine-monophosphate kinase